MSYLGAIRSERAIFTFLVYCRRLILTKTRRRDLPYNAPNGVLIDPRDLKQSIIKGKGALVNVKRSNASQTLSFQILYLHFFSYFLNCKMQPVETSVTF